MTGSLACVGTGMTLGAHICPLSKSYIEQADVVFSAVSHGITELWLQEMHPDVRSLQKYYQEGKSRQITYNEMVDAMMTEVRAGKKVVGAFYGHPGVFAQAPHKSIAMAKAEGYQARMVPGISAEDCLIADLAIDPGRFGCQQFEASQFMFYKRQYDPSCYLVLWQIGLAGDKSLAKFSTGAAHRQVLIELLSEVYPLDHQVILYEAAVLPIDTVRNESLSIADLAEAEIYMHTTLVIPPSQKMKPNKKVLDRLAEIELKFSHMNSELSNTEVV
ncbi:SAM-dependent methyltransferase [Shewanella sp. 1_MG-2023]|uniref:SAM-dependent methyltransferase n=1 Tax=unclassified Shewanella TaxID=196818 RepID=UPI0026E2A8DD|nr:MULTISPECIES: SAM-dependent methyltransferase [unclassified Shewanella]MDO6613824.1 SAM-dependent methyltransferase [Shewanella sp. 7_MG-2023]MDO6773574.1 SAM-dependent methyltransferase [Shewanella sp. 2_MG-2023]MDO6796431.1 SAM-dependent methyltransferase [Shewanella sp. 1_MG-2023]